MDLRTILIAVDFSGPSQAALAEGVHLASMTGAGLVLVHVLPDAAEEARDPDSKRLAKARLDMSAAAARTKSGAADAVLLEGDVSDALVSIARTRNADLLLMGTHGRAGIERIVQGSVAERVMRVAPCPLLSVRGDVIRPADFETRRARARVVAGVDLGPESKSVVREAASFAKQLGASLVLVHATGPAGGLERDGHDAQARASLERLAGLPRLEGLHVTCTAIPGSAADALLDAASSLGAAWLVAGSHRRSGPSRWLLGSVAESLMRAAPCPVLVVRDAVPAAADAVPIGLRHASLADEGEGR